MKRGFLRSEKGKAALASSPAPMPGRITGPMLEKMPHGKVDKTGPPEDYKPKKIKYVEIDANSTGQGTAEMPLFTTQPPQYLGATKADEPDGCVECHLTGAVKAELVSTPGYPRRRLVHPSVCPYSIGPVSGKGLGMIATRPLSTGDLILNERPLYLGPIVLIGHIRVTRDVTQEEYAQIVCLEKEKALEVAVGRMLPEDQAAYRALHNSHLEDGSGPLLGIFRTNGLLVKGIQDKTQAKEQWGQYSGVCKNLSRINHSCMPNATDLFDKPSLAFQVRACRDIAKGEEITISYCGVLASTSDRQAKLEPYGFRCTCASCCDEARGDKVRADILVNGPDVNSWLKDLSLPDDTVIQHSLGQVAALEAAGLEETAIYREHVHALTMASICIGDTEGAKRYGKKYGRLQLCHDGDEAQSQMWSSTTYHQANPLWKLRTNMRKQSSAF